MASAERSASNLASRVNSAVEPAGEKPRSPGAAPAAPAAPKVNTVARSHAAFIHLSRVWPRSGPGAAGITA